ncbi:unnamed protein product [Sphagnum troendelagicum]
MGVREIQQETDIGPSTQAPVSNDELGWNWKKPPVGQEPWSAWQKRMGDSDTVMVAAMAKCSQIKLIGYKQRRSTGRKLAPWPTTKNGSMHDRMTPPRKLYSSIMN